MNLGNNDIILRAIEDKDLDLLYNMINDPDIEKNVFGWSFPISKQNQLEWMKTERKDGNIRFVIEYNNFPVGVVSLSNIDFKNRTTNLNIKLLKNYRGKGIASRSIKILIEYVFEELNLNLITASVLEYNKESLLLWEKNGFTREANLRARIFKNGKYNNIVIFSLLRDEYEKRNWK